MPKYIPKRLHSPTGHPGLRPLTKPEILSPAGDWDCVHAAAENGADAIYFGLDRFNARMRAENFKTGDLPELMAFLHKRGMRGYLTFNTLLFTREIPEALRFLKDVIVSGVDAIIVQDAGACRLIRSLSPDVPIHASTQMSISSAAGVRFAHRLGASLAVIARECSLSETASVIESISGSDEDMPIEIFVHGALCVAYSGQCLTSEALGGRSANRGECAQACRLPYELIADGETVPLGDRRYLLSPQDLAGISLIPEIIRSGIASLKIEGRLKSPEYVAAVTDVYRRQLDKVWNAILQDHESRDFEQPSSEDRYTLDMTFSRGLGSGWLEGIHNQRLVHARFGKKRGVCVGTVASVDSHGVTISTKSLIRAGDGVVFDAGHPDKPEEGGRIMTIDERKNGAFLRFLPGAVDPRRIQAGQLVWKTSDPILEKRLRQSWQHPADSKTSPIQAIVSGSVGAPLELTFSDDSGNSTSLTSVIPLQKAEKRALDQDFLIQQIGRLGGSPFHLESLECRLPPDCMIPVSALNQLRRDGVAALIEQREQPIPWKINRSFDWAPAASLTFRPVNPSDVHFVPLVRTMEQFERILGLKGYRDIYLELDHPGKIREACEAFRKSRSPDSINRNLWLAPPRIFKPGEDRIIQQLLESGADGFLVRNYDHLEGLKGQRLRGDFSLNISNSISVEWFLKNHHLERITASYDLNQDQLLDLLRASPQGMIEITLHQHMPMFHMEHCLFCAFLTKGKDFRDCGRPCDSTELSVRDRVGMEHPVKADAGCRNTVFNGRAQTGAEYLDSFIQAGASVFRIEFLNESPDEMESTLRNYQLLLQGRIESSVLWRDLKLINQLGVTRGTLKSNH